MIKGSSASQQHASAQESPSSPTVKGLLEVRRRASGAGQDGQQARQSNRTPHPAIVSHLAERSRIDGLINQMLSQGLVKGPKTITTNGSQTKNAI
eukprot:156806-Pelagomonas_calceolata.AAC.2